MENSKNQRNTTCAYCNIRDPVFIKNWLNAYINENLGDLINLTTNKIENQYLRALSFQLYESNGVLKRKNIDEIINNWISDADF